MRRVPPPSMPCGPTPWTATRRAPSSPSGGAPAPQTPRPGWRTAPGCCWPWSVPSSTPVQSTTWPGSPNSSGTSRSPSPPTPRAAGTTQQPRSLPRACVPATPTTAPPLPPSECSPRPSAMPAAWPPPWRTPTSVPSVVGGGPRPAVSSTPTQRSSSGTSSAPVVGCAPCSPTSPGRYRPPPGRPATHKPPHCVPAWEPPH